MGRFIWICSLILMPFLSASNSMSSECYHEIEVVSDRVAEEFRQSYGMHRTIDGLLYMGFSVDRLVNEDEARLLVVKYVDKYVKQLNSNEYLTKNCPEYPFSYRNVRIDLFFQPNDIMSYEPNVSIVGSRREEIDFGYNVPGKEHGYSKKSYETYEQAKELALQTQKDGLDTRYLEFIEDAKWVFRRTARALYNKHGLKISGMGAGPKHFAARFDIFSPITVDKSRALLVDAINQLLEEINGDKGLKPHLERYPFTTDDIEVAIYSSLGPGKGLFPDRSYAPHVALIAYREGETLFGIRGRDGFLQKISEPYEMTVKLAAENPPEDRVKEFADEVAKIQRKPIIFD